MMKLGIVIPAQESNKYNKLGDLSAFGDTTLLEWKISQSKIISSDTDIYISSESNNIEAIAHANNVNFIKRDTYTSFTDVITSTLSEVKADHIMWLSCTSPFISSNDYMDMINRYNHLTDDRSLCAVVEKKDYIYFKDERLNFGNEFIDRDSIEPIYIATNGCYIIQKKLAINNKSLYSSHPYKYELDYLSSIEIKDINTFQISQELISAYFKRGLHV